MKLRPLQLNWSENGPTHATIGGQCIVITDVFQYGSILENSVSVRCYMSALNLFICLFFVSFG